MHVEKRGHKFKREKKGISEGSQGLEGKQKSWNYIIISKIKKI